MTSSTSLDRWAIRAAKSNRILSYTIAGVGGGIGLGFSITTKGEIDDQHGLYQALVHR